MVRRHPNKLLEKHKKENEELKAKLTQQAKQLEAMGTGPPPQKKQKKGEKTDEEKVLEHFFSEETFKVHKFARPSDFRHIFLHFFEDKNGPLAEEEREAILKGREKEDSVIGSFFRDHGKSINEKLNNCRNHCQSEVKKSL